MKFSLLAISLLFFALISKGQIVKVGDSLEIAICQLDKVIHDSDQLNLKIVYRNISKRPVRVYKELKEGYFNDKFYNINIIVEKEAHGQYLGIATPYYDPDSRLVFADSLRHYDLPKSKLLPAKNDTLIYNLYHLREGFDAGNYRIRINLRYQTIRDDTPHQYDSTGASVPPEDEIKYITSDWIYFRVTRRVYKSR